MDEVWWSRFALPNMQLWQDQQRVRLQEQTAPVADLDGKALACYGLWCEREGQMLLRFVDRRPVSHVTTAFLGWACAELVKRGKRVLVLIWDNASWHVSKEVQKWIVAHNSAAKQSKQGLRLVVVR